MFAIKLGIPDMEDFLGIPLANNPRDLGLTSHEIVSLSRR